MKTRVELIFLNTNSKCPLSNTQSRKFIKGSRTRLKPQHRKSPPQLRTCLHLYVSTHHTNLTQQTQDDSSRVMRIPRQLIYICIGTFNSSREPMTSYYNLYRTFHVCLWYMPVGRGGSPTPEASSKGSETSDGPDTQITDGVVLAVSRP